MSIEIVKKGDLVTPLPHLKWVPLMSDELERSNDVHKTLYGNKVDVVRFQQGQFAIIIEVDDSQLEKRVRLMYLGGFWWATGSELRVIQ